MRSIAFGRKMKRSFLFVSLFMFLISSAAYAASSEGNNLGSAATVVDIKVSEAKVSLVPGEEDQITVTALYSDNTSEDVTKQTEWKSSDLKVATVEKGNIIANQAGTAKIKATFNGKTKEVSVKVLQLKSIYTDHNSLNMVAGEKLKLKIRAKYEGNRIIDISNKVTLTSSNTETVIVDSNRYLVAKGTGFSAITASYEDKQIDIAVNVIVGKMLDNHVTDAIIHPTKPIIYMTDFQAKKLYAFNYSTGEFSSISFALNPERVVFANNELYVALLVKEHSPYWWDDEQEGKIAIIDPQKFKVKEELTIDTDPYDLVVDKSGYIYVASGSGQWTNITSYSRKLKLKVDQKSIYDGSFIELHPTLGRIYSITTGLSPRDMIAYNVSKGQFTDPEYGGYDSPYHGDYAMSEYSVISPDGKYLFNGAGTIFASTKERKDDMVFVNQLDPDYRYDSIAFHLKDSRFYAGSSESPTIFEFDYKSLKKVKDHETMGLVKYLFYRDKQLITIELLGKDKDDQNKYLIQSIRLK